MLSVIHSYENSCKKWLKGLKLLRILAFVTFAANDGDPA
jgi:hypothetical protein